MSDTLIIINFCWYIRTPMNKYKRGKLIRMVQLYVTTISWWSITCHPQTQLNLFIPVLIVFSYVCRFHWKFGALYYVISTLEMPNNWITMITSLIRNQSDQFIHLVCISVFKEQHWDKVNRFKQVSNFNKNYWWFIDNVFKTKYKYQRRGYCSSDLMTFWWMLGMK